MIFLLLVFIVISNCLEIKTNFKYKSDIFDPLRKGEFYLKTINMINPIEYKFNQIVDSKKKIKFPLIINYKQKSFIKTCSFIPKPSINVNQTWDLKDNVISIISYTRFLKIETKINVLYKNNYYYLNIQNNIKKFLYIPNKIINLIINDIFGLINNLIKK